MDRARLDESIVAGGRGGREPRKSCVAAGIFSNDGQRLRELGRWTHYSESVSYKVGSMIDWVTLK